MTLGVLLIQQKRKTMKLSVKTSGAAPSEFVEFEAKFIADCIQFEMNGAPARDSDVEKMTQVFVNQSDLKAVYSGGTFMYLKVSDDTMDMYEAL